MKLIDVDKLIEFIKELKKESESSRRDWTDNNFQFGQESACDNILEYIDTLQQEQPSLPSNLDEAAQDIVNDAIDTNDTTIVKYQKLLEYLVRAGAEWMAEQGMTMEITDDTEWADLDSFVHKNVTGGSIIQIRKK